MANLGAEPALDAEHGVGVLDVDQFVEWLTERCGGQIPPDVANFFILGKKKTTDHGAEPALDEPNVISSEALRLLSLFVDYKRQQDLGSPPKEKKDTNTSAKKRKTGPRDSPKVSSAKKRKTGPRDSPQVSALKEIIQEKQNEMNRVRCSERVNNKLAKMEKDMTIVEKDVETLKKHKTLDESQEKQLETLKSELAKIKNNVDKINEEGAKKIDNYIRKKKKWQSKQEQATTEMEKSVEEAKEDKNKAKEKAKQNIAAAKEWEKDEKERINREIQNFKDEEDKEKTIIKNNIEAKENTLANKRNQFEENIKIMNEEQAKTIAEIDAEMQKLNDDESKMKEANDRKISEKRKASDELKRKIREEEYAMNRKIKKLEADIKYLEEKKARKENERKKDFELKRNNKQKLEESIKAIQQEDAKKLDGIKAEIKTLLEKETQAKLNLDANTKYLQMLNKLAVITEETENNLFAKELAALMTSIDINMCIQEIKERETKFEEDEKESKKRIASRQQRLAEQKTVLENKIKAMQKGEQEETKQYDAIIKNMHELSNQIKKYNVEKSVEALFKK